MPSLTKPKILQRSAAIVVAGAMSALALTACSSSGSSADVTITLSGPNQFTSDTSTFGPAWNELVKGFEKANPHITLKTNVLPIASWAQASAAQLTAGTAPELIFAQTAHKVGQIASLNSYLNKPNPYSGSSAKWLDSFKGEYFGGPDNRGTNARGQYEAIPFNLVTVGIYYNKNILSKVGVSTTDLSTFDGFTQACSKIKAAGYAPVATDNSALDAGWALTAIQSMTMNDVYSSINDYKNDGTAGTSVPIASKSLAKALLSKSVDLTMTAAMADTMKVLKRWYDQCASPNWSGIAPASGFTGATAFPGGKAAMAWGTNFSSTALKSVPFKYGTTPFPALSASDASSADGSAAQFGVNNGGTAYMIPSYITGAKKAAAVRFLQYVSSPKIKSWLGKTGSISALTAVPDPAGLSTISTGDWAKLPISGQNGGLVALPAALAGQNEFQGYLLGTKSLSSMLTTLQQNGTAWAKEQAKQAGWTEPWAKN